MCLTAKEALEWAGSTWRSTARAGAANNAIARADFMHSSGLGTNTDQYDRAGRAVLRDLPEADQRRGIAVAFLQGDQRALRERAARQHVLDRIEGAARVVASLHRPGGKPGSGRGEQLPGEVSRAAAARSVRVERVARDVPLELEPLREGPALRQLPGGGARGGMVEKADPHRRERVEVGRRHHVRAAQL